MDNSKFGIQFWNVMLILMTNFASSRQDIVCQSYKFETQCAQDEVIIITSAKYGRMNVTSCVSRDYGYIGCGADVLEEADKFCSGRRHCTMSVPNTLFDKVGVCPNDLRSYLEAEHTCVKVLNPSVKVCPPSSVVQLRANEGSLASILTEETELGSATCPYVIDGPKGATIKFTLIDFATKDNSMERMLHAYLTIREENPADRITIFSSKERQRDIYTSKSSHVQVRMMTSSRTNAENSHFLLKYKILGCANPSTDTKTIFKRYNDIGTFSCTNTDEEWDIRCVNHEWSGRIANCSQPVINRITDEQNSSITHRMSLVLVACIALALGATILIIGILFLRWKRSQRSPYEDVYPSQEAKLGENVAHDQYGNPRMSNIPPSGGRHDYGYGGKENEYAYISDYPPNAVYDSGVGRSIDSRHMEMYQARMCDIVPYGTYAHGQGDIASGEVRMHRQTPGVNNAIKKSNHIVPPQLPPPNMPPPYEPEPHTAVCMNKVINAHPLNSGPKVANDRPATADMLHGINDITRSQKGSCKNQNVHVQRKLSSNNSYNAPVQANDFIGQEGSKPPMVAPGPCAYDHLVNAGHKSV